MSLHDGFFDAKEDGFNEDGTIKYDREYGSKEFVEYFDQMIGSGVCVHHDPDSMKVRLAEGGVIVHSGYLFLQGYWLKNDDDYPLPVPSSGTYAVAAHLDLGERRIELLAQPAADEYPDSLVLALVNVGAGTVDDTRSNKSLCGVIDTAASLSAKIEYALDYIENNVQSKIEAAQEAMQEKVQELDAKIDEVQTLADNIAPAPIGTVIFTAEENPGDDWLLCDGRYIDGEQYPQLVEALGKLLPSGDELKLVSEGNIPAGITNGVFFESYLWTYSYTDKKLYGIGINNIVGNVWETPVKCSHAKFADFIAPNTARPLVLSIVPNDDGYSAKLFLSQIISDGGSASDLNNENWMNHLLVFCGDFQGAQSEITLTPAFTKVAPGRVEVTGAFSTYSITYQASRFYPSVISKKESGVDTYYCVAGTAALTQGTDDRSVYNPIPLKWTDGAESAQLIPSALFGMDVARGFLGMGGQRCGFSKKSKDEFVAVCRAQGNGTAYSYWVSSGVSGLFRGTECGSSGLTERTDSIPLNIAGEDKAIASFTPNTYPTVDINGTTAQNVSPATQIPSGAKVFPDAGIYLWDKRMYMIFVGTGFVFSRTMEPGDIGYLDTTSILGTITQFGSIDYDETHNDLCIIGQDAANKVKVARMRLSTMYEYASSGAWLPTLAMDGIPAYIRAANGGER